MDVSIGESRVQEPTIQVDALGPRDLSHDTLDGSDCDHSPRANADRHVVVKSMPVEDRTRMENGVRKRYCHERCDPSVPAAGADGLTTDDCDKLPQAVDRLPKFDVLAENRH